MIKTKKYYVSNGYKKVYMEIEAKDHHQAGNIFEDITTIKPGVIYTEKNWVRWCGETQATFFEWSEIKSTKKIDLKKY